MSASAAEHSPPANSPDPGRSVGWILLITLMSVAALLAYRLPHLQDALFSDETMYLLKAAMFKSGGLPYRDLWDHHPPGLELLLALLPMSFLKAEASLRLVSVATLGATVFFAADLMRRSRVHPAAIFAGAAVFTLYHCLDWFAAFYLEPEHAMALTLTLMVWVLRVHKKPAWAWFFWGLTTVFKQSAIAFLPLLLVLDFGERESRKNLDTRRVLLRACAAAAPWLLIVAYFAVRGAFTELVRDVVIDALRRRNEHVSQYCSSWFRWGFCRDFHTLIYGIALLLLISCQRLRQSPWANVIFSTGVLWMGSAVFYLWLQKCGLQYYYALTTPGLLWLTAGAFNWSGSQWRSAATRMQRFIQGLLLLLLLFGLALPFGRLSTNQLPSWLPTTRYTDNTRGLARQIKSRIDGSYRVLSVQDYPGWYWYLDQPPPRLVWIPYQLHAFPEQQESIVRMAADYGRGKKLLLIYFDSPGNAKPQVTEFRERLRVMGAHSVDLHELLAVDAPPGFSADLWDLQPGRQSAVTSLSAGDNASVEPPRKQNRENGTDISIQHNSCS